MTYDIKSIKDKLNAAKERERKKKANAEPVGWRAQVDSLKDELLVPTAERIDVQGMQDIVDKLQDSLKDFCEHPEKYLDAERAKDADISSFLIDIESSLPYAKALLSLAKDLENNDFKVYPLSDDSIKTLKNINNNNQINQMVVAMIKVFMDDNTDFMMPVEYCSYTIGPDHDPRSVLQGVFNLSVKSSDYIRQYEEIHDWEKIITAYETQKTHEVDLLKKIEAMKARFAGKPALKRREPKP